MLILIVTLFLQPTFAQTSDLKSKALQEIEQPEKSKPGAQPQEAQGTGMLRLADPNPPLQTRHWDYFVQLSAQIFQPKGSLSNGLTNSQFQLDSSSSTVMPAFELGFDAPMFRGRWNWNWGVAGRVGYANEKTSAVFSSGYRDTDVRLDTTMLSLAPFVAVETPYIESLWFNLGFEYGLVDYSQASSDALANVNSHSTFDGISLGAEYRLFESWSFLLNYSLRSLTSSNQQIALQKDTIELGTKILW